MLNILPALLIVEDDEGLHSQYKWILKSLYQIFFAVDRTQAISLFNQVRPSVVLLDLGLPPDCSNATEGLSALQEMLAINPLTHVVVITGSEQRQHAMDAIAFGAIDFQPKGISGDELKIALRRAYMMSDLAKENKELRQNAASVESDVIGDSPLFLNSLKVAQKVAESPFTVMLLGESGAGKEVFSNYIHRQSHRKGEMVAINCASIPAELLESELFGHEKGAFTGAVQAKIGKIERANGGTLFLDEIGDMPLLLQAKLLRFLQEKEIERVGGKKSFSVDVRVICATHRDLQEMVKLKLFREDLFYRLSEVTIEIPPLRERGGDIVLLAKWFLQHYSREFKRPIEGFSQEAIRSMQGYSWPGNVRELQNKIKTSIIMAENKYLSSSDLKLPVKERSMGKTVEIETLAEAGLSLEDVRKKAESEALIQALNSCNGNITAASKMLGITRPTFYAIANKHGLSIHESSGFAV